MRRIQTLVILAALVAILWGNAGPQMAFAQPVATPAWQAPVSTGDCRFAVAYSGVSGVSNDSIARYDLPLLGMGYYLDYNNGQKPASVPAYIRYIEVLRVSDGAFPNTLANLPAALVAHPGATWIIGNEPEDRGQDRVTAEVYAERFYQYATVIRSNDANAQIGFGSIVMPTILRLMYLDFAWARLIELAGSQAAASALVDIWAPHNFILNEQGDQNGQKFWGAGIPWGFDTRVPPVDWQGLQEIITIVPDVLPYEFYNFPRFRDRMIRFRQWMKDHGEQNKPLWLSEFGQLAPPLTHPEENLVTVPDTTTADFMIKTLDWMLTATDANLGLPVDQNRLVQKWFWYSINHDRYQFGGTMVDPITLAQTPVAYTWINYVPPAGSIVEAPPDLYPLSGSLQFMGFTSSNPLQGSYRLKVRIRNAIISDNFVDLQVKVKDGGATIASNTGRTARCGGDAVLTFDLPPVAVVPDKLLCAEVLPASLTDQDTTNNTLCFKLPTHLIYMPAFRRN